MLGSLKYTKFHKMSMLARDKAPLTVQQPACSADIEYKGLSVNWCGSFTSHLAHRLLYVPSRKADVMRHLHPP